MSLISKIRRALGRGSLKFFRHWLETSKSPIVYVRRYNRWSRWWPDFKLRLDLEDGTERPLIRAFDDVGSLYLARPSRIVFQMRGIAARREQLCREYCISDDLIAKGDVVVDCGANVGEVTLIAAERGAEAHAFEPDRIEFQALQANTRSLDKVQCHQVALWKDNGSRYFYDRNDTGDSSLIEGHAASEGYDVETVRMDDFLPLQEVPKIRLVKLEAEGAEPEILDGMVSTLRRIEYLTVDMGPERGVENANTVTDVVGRLNRAGFELVAFSTPRCVGLFRRRDS